MPFSPSFHFASLGGRVDVAVASSLLNRLDELSEKVEAYRKGWDYVFLGFLLIANCIIIYRQALRRQKQVLADFAQQELQRVQSEHAAGKWEKLPPTEAMQQVVRISPLSTDGFHQDRVLT
jgi:hypothetical protein